MKLLTALFGLAALGLTAPAALAADADQVSQGQHAYAHWCAPCHAGGLWEGHPLPGTMSLQMKYKGARPPVLEDRTDLSPAYVGFIIRNGSGGMPFFRKTEVSDADKDAIAAYLVRNNK